MNFIKLTDHNGEWIYLNASMLLMIETWVSNGSKIRMVMNDQIIKVKESPEEVIKKVKTGSYINLINKNNESI